MRNTYLALGRPQLHRIALAVAAVVAAMPSWALLAQDPVLTRASAVRPNILVILDNSQQMKEGCIMGANMGDRSCPPVLPPNWSTEDPDWLNPPTYYDEKTGHPAGGQRFGLGDISYEMHNPINNLLWYNPRRAYRPAVPLNTDPNAGREVDLIYPIVQGATTLDTRFQSGWRVTISKGLFGITHAPARPYYLTEFTSTYSNPFGPHGGSRPDCAGPVCTNTEERWNVAKWAARHGTRFGAAKTSLSEAFANQPDTFRLAWASVVGNTGSAGSNGDQNPTPMKDYGLAKAEFQAWMDRLTPDGAQHAATPSWTGPKKLRNSLAIAGKYFSRDDKAGPWSTKPWEPTSAAASAPHLSCRRSHTILISDSFQTVDAVEGDVDSNALPDIKHANGKITYAYKPGDRSDVRNLGKSDRAGGGPGVGNTLADVALKYWGTDLRPDLPNNVSEGRAGDTPFWQNMTTHTVGLSAPGTLNDDQLAKAKRGLANWPTPVFSLANPSTLVDDFRHAAHNAGGESLDILFDGDAASDQLTRLISKITAGNQVSSAGVVGSSITAADGVTKVRALYVPNTWWGNVELVELNAKSEEKKVLWRVVEVDASGVPTGNTTLPKPAERKIFVWSDAAQQAIDFTYGNLTKTGNTFVGPNANLQVSSAISPKVVDFLRGDRSQEGWSFRRRTAVLGDVVNSQPVFVKKESSQVFDRLPAGSPGLEKYAAYMAAKQARSEGVIFVGANDGMLHAFGEGTSVAKGGRELFAFVPRSVLGKLEGLAHVGYASNHRFTVDGPLAETDVYHPDATTGASGWRNLVIGSAGAGAKAVFALDATRPLEMSGKSVLWEINSDPDFPKVAGNSATAFQELGHLLSPVLSGVTTGGQWVSLFGNGYDSKSGRASLFVVESATGKLLKEIATDGLTGNGLGAVAPAFNSRGQILGVYAGDMHGRLWKFDLSADAPGGWKLGNGNLPVIKAIGDDGKAQPITAAPGVAERSAGVSAPGYMVSFGTGRVQEMSDLQGVPSMQTAYSVWDKTGFGAVTGKTVLASQLEPMRLSKQDRTQNKNLSKSFGQSLNSGQTDAYGVDFVNPAVKRIDWDKRPGWKLNLDFTPGARVIGPVRVDGDVAIFEALVPPVENGSCEPVRSVTFMLDPRTGRCQTGGTFDINLDGAIDKQDASVCGYETVYDGVDLTLKLPPGIDGRQDYRHGVTSVGVEPYKVGNGAENCGNGGYAAEHAEECTAGCTNALFVAKNPGACVVSRSWRQIFPRGR